MSRVGAARRAIVFAAAALVAGTLPSTVRPAAAAGSAGVVGPLGVAGNQIVDGNGAPITLRGIQRDRTQDTGYGSSIAPVTATEVAAMRSWGANVVRIPLNAAAWSDVCSAQHDPRYVQAIDDLVHLVNADGMVALLDVHVSSGGVCGAVFRHRAPDQTTVTFWREAAAHFANWPLVAFELFNEPHLNKGPDVWLHGQSQAVIDCSNANSAVPICSTYVPVGEQQLYDAVEATGARNLVIVDADGWAANPVAVVQGTGVDDYNHNIAYAVHPYQCNSTAITCTANPAKQAANTKVLDSFLPVAKNYPVVATEFGWPNARTGAGFYTNTYDYLEGQTPAWGSVAFGWNGSLSGPFQMLATLSPSYNPSPSGVPVRAELLSHS